MLFRFLANKNNFLFNLLYKHKVNNKNNSDEQLKKRQNMCKLQNKTHL